MRPFGRSKTEIWRQRSEEVGGTMTSSWRGEKVQVQHEQWVLTLDTYVVMANNTPLCFTRMRAPFVNPSAFRFVIRGVINDIDRLKDRFELFAVTLDRLAVTGSAEPVAPDVTL